MPRSEEASTLDVVVLFALVNGKYMAIGVMYRATPTRLLFASYAGITSNEQQYNLMSLPRKFFCCVLECGWCDAVLFFFYRF